MVQPDHTLWLHLGQKSMKRIAAILAIIAEWTFVTAGILILFAFCHPQ